MNEKKWYAAEVTVSAESHEAIEYGLMEAGALGTETRDADPDHLTIVGYFPATPEIEIIRAALADAGRVYGFTPDAALDLKIEEVPDRDWLAEWKKGWQPIRAGRFIVAPPWIEPASLKSTHGSDAGLIIIRIEPGMAFGTGTHETTRLCLKVIEKHFRGGSFLDVGTGTGILAIAAAKMLADARIEACDTDAEAIEIAKDNARLNEAAGQIEFRVGSVGNQTASADLVCANLTAPVIVELLPALLGATCGRLVLSGILDTQAEMVQTRVSELGASILETDQDGEWVALVV
ncbi:MAG TPA: 50S ribosomal protein L11 methyltransferase [Pyrinomonadaceae bacterium]|nr:50S ribosomal protein L11 methyltransferase [Pyrinomonadaceae bacterium]